MLCGEEHNVDDVSSSIEDPLGVIFVSLLTWFFYTFLFVH